jgi:branched-chain amino acid transport system ATP-binding protein
MLVRTMLTCSHLGVSYGPIAALHRVTLAVQQGETVALLGANGAGKTTLLKAISGLIPLRAGDILYDGASLARLSCAARVGLGIAQVPEGRRIFPGLTVQENLMVATASWRRWGESGTADFERVFELFPRLKERRSQLGWSLSGGEQQMLAIGRALMARPRLLLLDEPSLGLAPQLAEDVYERIQRIAEAGLTILVVEQNTVLALEVANRGYVLENGHVVLEGRTDELKQNPRVREAYLGR